MGSTRDPSQSLDRLAISTADFVILQIATKKTPPTDAEKIRSYGPQFKYEEFMVGPNIISSAIISIGVMLFALLLSFSPVSLS